MRAASSELPGLFARSMSFQLGQRVEAGALLIGGHPLGRRQVDDRVADGAEERPLVGGRHEPGAPVVGSAERAAAVVVHHDVGGQARRLRAEAVGDPRPDAREAHADLATLHLVGRLDMVVRAAVERPDERHLVDLAGEVREDLRDLDAALPVPLELERARHERTGVSLANHHRVGHRLAGVLLQGRLRVEGVDLADTARS